MPQNTPTWDYTEHAAHYDRRADYSGPALEKLFMTMGLKPGDRVADLGAGTGKLTVPMAKAGFSILASEPNNAMRSFGIKNTEGMNVQWFDGTGEHSKLSDDSVKAVTFGSSFNVVDHNLALTEVRRICQPKGWVACMWNHRDLDDPVQKKIEEIIGSHIENYDYGTRRKSPISVLEESGLFDKIVSIEEIFSVEMRQSEIIDAWKSHATLSRQAGVSFQNIISEIETFLKDKETYLVPYYTRIWAAHLRD